MTIFSRMPDISGWKLHICVLVVKIYETSLVIYDVFFYYSERDDIISECTIKLSETEQLYNIHGLFIK